MKLDCTRIVFFVLQRGTWSSFFTDWFLELIECCDLLCWNKFCWWIVNERELKFTKQAQLKLNRHSNNTRQHSTNVNERGAAIQSDSWLLRYSAPILHFDGGWAEERAVPLPLPAPSVTQHYHPASEPVPATRTRHHHHGQCQLLNRYPGRFCVIVCVRTS